MKTINTCWIYIQPRKFIITTIKYTTSRKDNTLENFVKIKFWGNKFIITYCFSLTNLKKYFSISHSLSLFLSLKEIFSFSHKESTSHSHKETMSQTNTEIEVVPLPKWKYDIINSEGEPVKVTLRKPPQVNYILSPLLRTYC